MSDSNLPYLKETAQIVSSHLAKNPMPHDQLPGFIREVYATLTRLKETIEEKPEVTPPVPIRSSVQPDHIVCLEDGKKLKTLKRHLWHHYHMTPEDYRKKWNLPADYPMTAPAYAQTRSQLAKKIGLGKSRHSRRGSEIDDEVGGDSGGEDHVHHIPEGVSGMRRGRRRAA